MLGRFVYWLLYERWDELNSVLNTMIKVEFPRRSTVQHVSAYRGYCRNYPERMGKGLPPIHDKLNARQLLEYEEFQRKYPKAKRSLRPPKELVETGESLRSISVRWGQQEFSAAVRENFGNRCCFPDCDVDEPELLIGAHIQRWADEKTTRGQVKNGLCFCGLHDRAFEIGLFVLTDDYCVRVNPSSIREGRWIEQHLRPFEGRRIELGRHFPSVEALQRHRTRHRAH